MKNKTAFSLYVHVPFCASKCHYCDFYSFAGSAAQMDVYVHAMCKKIEQFAPQFVDRQVDTIYFGGGTPSLLTESRLIPLLDCIRCFFSVQHDAEITVECNPDSMNQSLLNGLMNAGVNRLSIGVQSAHDQELQRLGRRHTFAQAQQAVQLAHQIGFVNVSLDLMYGLPGQTKIDVMQSIEAFLELQPKHISCYSLKLEAGTPMACENPVLPDEDDQAEWYLALCERLEQAGFEHYEVSNWAKPTFRSRHNSRYWTMSDYLGIGPGAHSYLNGKRFAYPSSLEDFCNDAVWVQEQPVAGFGEKEEYLMLSLRTADGINGDEFTKQFGQSFDDLAQRLARLERYGLTAPTAVGWRLTDRGFLVSNLILTDVLGIGG